MASMNFKGRDMVNDRHEHYEDEESEYQFSDDQIDYELEPESKAPEATQPVPKKSLLTKLTPYRRMIIGLVVFFVVLFIVYKLLTPGTTTTAPPTEFNPNSAANPIPANPPAAQQPVVPAGKITNVSAVTSPSPSAPVAQPPAAPQPVAQSYPPTTSSAVEAPSNVQAPASTSIPAASPAIQPPQTQAQMNPPTQPQPSPASSMVQPTPPQPMPFGPQGLPMNPPPASMSMQTPPAPPMGQAMELANKISGLENQNANMMNTIQTQFAQKMSEYEMQNRLLQEKVLILNKRLANMEATLNKMAQIVREGGIRTTRTVVAAPRPPEPKMIYTIQAIIPGRAWLKSETGDTVTVAEGDLLKDYGRIVKIDPYDGIVQIDNGNRIISLSYGATGD